MRSLIALTVISSLTLTAAETGHPAPVFSLPGHDGKTWTLADLAGKTVVLEWVNYDCPFVKKHYATTDGGTGNMQALQKTYTAKGVVWLSINSSAPGKQGHLTAETATSSVAARGAAPTAVLLDPDGTVGRTYDAKTTPHLFVIDGTGTLVYQGAIDSLPSTDGADVAKADNYLKAALDAVLAGKPVAQGTTKAYGCSVKYAK